MVGRHDAHRGVREVARPSEDAAEPIALVDHRRVRIALGAVRAPRRHCKHQHAVGAARAAAAARVRRDDGWHGVQRVDVREDLSLQPRVGREADGRIGRLR
eukprot:5171791-Prymnesium_polylepis.1